MILCNITRVGLSYTLLEIELILLQFIIMN
jgi:hypothetical protein